MNEREMSTESELTPTLDVRVLDEAVGLWLGLRVEPTSPKQGAETNSRSDVASES